MGHDEPGQLTEALRRDPYAVLLFDEVEKAHREVTSALLSLLDAGRLTDAHGRTVDATHAMVILTSNLGADLILGRPGGDVEAVRGPVLTLARAVLRPELVNRVDEVVLFAALSPGRAGRDHRHGARGDAGAARGAGRGAHGVGRGGGVAGRAWVGRVGVRSWGRGRCAGRSAARWTGGCRGCCWRARSARATRCASTSTGAPGTGRSTAWCSR